MKIFLPFKQNDIGGTITFVEKFSKKLRESKMEIFHTFKWQFDVIFIIADCPLRYPLYAKLMGKKIIQRLDGVYHPATPVGRFYPLYNFKMRIIHSWLADTVIYQSEFSKRSCEKFLGKTGAENAALIYNGVEIPDTNTPRQTRKDSDPIRLVTFSKFRRRDQIEPLIESVKLLDSEKYTFDIYGSYTDNLKYFFRHLPSHIRFRGKQEHKELLKIIGQYDIFLFSDQSACPNSVLEALAAGLPIVAFDRGSIGEIVQKGYNGNTVPLDTHDPYRTAYPFIPNNYTAFRHAVEETVKGDLARYSENTTEDARQRFSLSKMFILYYEILRLKK